MHGIIVRSFIFSLLTIYSNVGCVTISSNTGDFQTFLGKRINNQTYLTNVSISLDQSSLCMYKCFSLINANGSCFAAQYVKGSYVCQLQLNCGVVLLQTAGSDTSVYVQGSVVRASTLAVRPLVFYSFVKDCDPTFNANYGLLPVSGSMKIVGNPGYITNTAYPTILQTLWFPKSTYPATTYAEINDTNGSLDFLQSGSWTLSYMLNTNSTISYMPVVSFFAGTPNICVSFRMNGNSGTYYAYDANCSPNSYSTSKGLMDDLSTINGWAHAIFSYDNSTGTVTTYMNGIVHPPTAASMKYTVTFKKSISMLQFGACNGCTIYSDTSAVGSIACLQILQRVIMEDEASQLYSQCVNGVVFIA